MRASWLLTTLSLGATGLTADAGLSDLRLTCRAVSALRSLTSPAAQPAQVGVALLTERGLDGGAYRAAFQEAAQRFAEAGIALRLQRWESVTWPVRPTWQDVGRLAALHRGGAQVVVLIAAQGLHGLAAGGHYRRWSGLADPLRGWVVLDPAAGHAGPRDLASDLQHELAHLFFVTHEAAATAMGPRANGELSWSPAALSTLAAYRHRPWW